ncbi:MAG: helix-turn-helix domain-containing protein [Acidobacteria bacterium]|nr:helix-turn-helix domain-containing protein [Acidobacteriota bacterium]MCA1638389.1 helix-turn-helix domain-containing protein [Acidobacteriota bacterium]
MIETLEKLFTPKELDEKKIISTVKQWQERKSGRLKCYRIGKKILYSEQHLRHYFEQSEKKAT